MPPRQQIAGTMTTRTLCRRGGLGAADQAAIALTEDFAPQRSCEATDIPSAGIGNSAVRGVLIVVLDQAFSCRGVNLSLPAHDGRGDDHDGGGEAESPRHHL